jgi:hypothetical protein
MEARATIPPKKRQKNEAGPDYNRMDTNQIPAPEQGPRPGTEREDVAPLRGFPVPTQPRPPSKFVLARQGLDRSLANAEIIDPRTTLSLKEENELTRRLSARMRKRLGELEITELFASKLLCPSPLGYLPTSIQSIRLSSRSSSPIRGQDLISTGHMTLRGISSPVPQRGVAKRWRMWYRS